MSEDKNLCVLCGDESETPTCSECTENLKQEMLENCGTIDDCKTCGGGRACTLEPQFIHRGLAVHGQRISALESSVSDLTDLLREIMGVSGKTKTNLLRETMDESSKAKEEGPDGD